MSRTTTTLALGSKFVADEHSLIRVGLGASVDWSAWGTATVIPAGTAVEIGADGVIPADGTGTAYLTVADVVKSPAHLIGGDGTVGLLAGGQIYENRLPAALSAGVKTALGARFGFQNAPDGFVADTTVLDPI